MRMTGSLRAVQAVWALNMTASMPCSREARWRGLQRGVRAAHASSDENQSEKG
jgi:hypothetical protein